MIKSLLTIGLAIFTVTPLAVAQDGDEEKPGKVSPIPGGKYSIQEILNTDPLTGAVRVYTSHDNPPQWKIDLLKRAFTVMEKDENATFEVLLDDPEIRNIMDTHGMELLGGPMLGQISQTSATVWVRTIGSAEVTVSINDNGKERLLGPVTSRAEDDFGVIVDVDGLKPDSDYSYQVLIDGKPMEGASGVIRTLNGKTDRIAFGSCPHRWGLGRQELWDRIISRGNKALLIYGDIAVQDRMLHYGLHRFDYFMRDLQAPWKKLSANVPVFACWDDHDFMNNDTPRYKGNNGDEKLAAMVKSGRDGIREVFKTSWNNPQYGFGDDGGGVFLRTRVGPADVIMLDNRYYRGNEGPYLGEPQMKWLEQQLLDCDGPFIILSCGTLWNDAKGDGKDSWGLYDKAGRERIFSFIEKNRIPGVLLLSGDWHGARGYRIERPSGYTFYEFQPASLGGRPGATRVPDTFFATAGVYAFGEFTFDTTKKDPEVTFRLVLEDGTIYHEQTFTRSELTPPR